MTPPTYQTNTILRLHVHNFSQRMFLYLTAFCRVINPPLVFFIFPQLRNKEPFTDPSIDFSGEATVIKFLSFKVLIFVGNATCCPKICRVKDVEKSKYFCWYAIYLLHVFEGNWRTLQTNKYNRNPNLPELSCLVPAFSHVFIKKREARMV